MIKEIINFVSDIIDNKGNVWPLQILKEKYDININFLHYYTVQSLVNNIIVKNKKENNFEIKTPCIPFHMKVVLNHNKIKKQSISRCVKIMTLHCGVIYNGM